MKRIICYVWIAGLWLLGLCSSYGQDAEFKKICESGAQSSSIAVNGKENWCFLKSELRHLSVGDFWGENSAKVSQANDPKAKDPLAAIVTYKETLEKEGVQMLLVPIPPKAVIYPDKLKGASLLVKRYDTSLQKFYALLKEKGVNVLDLTERLLKARTTSEPLYCMGDSHFSSEGCKVIAQVIASEVKKRVKVKETAKYTVDPKKFSFTGDLYKVAKEMPASEERVMNYVTGMVTHSEDSPILILGDSHTLVFEVGGDLFVNNAGLPSQLAAALNMPVDVIGVRGSGATPARVNLYRKSKQNKDYLKKKKIIIWCFSAREFTESNGWTVTIPIK